MKHFNGVSGKQARPALKGASVEGLWSIKSKQDTQTHTHVHKTHAYKALCFLSHTLPRCRVQKNRGRYSSLLTRPHKQASSPHLPPLEKEAAVFLGNPGSSMPGWKEGRKEGEEESTGVGRGGSAWWWVCGGGGGGGTALWWSEEYKSDQKWRSAEERKIITWWDSGGKAKQMKRATINEKKQQQQQQRQTDHNLHLITRE